MLCIPTPLQLSMNTNRTVQMYYVSEGSPVALAGSPNMQDRNLPQEPGKLSELGQAFVYKPVSTSQSQHYNPSGTELQRSDSLESLLSLNVLAFQLLNDHDDLQNVDDSYPSPSSKEGTFSPHGSATSNYSRAHVHSHNRFDSYSTISTSAPETPPSEHYASFHITEKSPSSEVTSGHGSSQHESIQGSLSPDHLRSIGKTHMRSDMTPASALPPRIESSIIKKAMLPEGFEADAELSQANGYTSLDDQKTPVAEISNPLCTSASDGTLQNGGDVQTWRNEQAADLHSDSNHVNNGSLEMPRIDTKTPADAENEQPAARFKGKARAVDQEIESVCTVNDEERKAHVEVPPVYHSGPSSTLEAPSTSQDASPVPASPSNKKISDWLREQYEHKQRSGGSVAHGPVPSMSEKTDRPDATFTASDSQSNASLHASSSRDRAAPQIPSSNSQKSNLAAGNTAERAQLLHTIINQDFGKPPAAGMRPAAAPQSRDMLWHPTEYVGPPRRRSVSGTSVLGFGRKTQESRPAMEKHHRQRSADLLRTSEASARQQGVDELGRRHKFAASADDLLMRTGPEPEVSSGSNDMFAYESITPSARNRLFSIRRKQSPLTPASSQFGGPTDLHSSDKPFHYMVDTNAPISSTTAERPSLGHKRSISGSIQEMLSGFTSSSFSRRKRNVSVTEVRRSPALSDQPRSVSPFPTSASVGAADQNGYDASRQPQQHSLRQISGGQSPFKLWRYPPTLQSHTSDDPSHAHNGPANAIHVNQTQLVACSSPSVAQKQGISPENLPISTGRFHAGSRALSNAETIEETEGEDDAISAGSGEAEQENEVDKRLKSLASQQVVRDSDLRARLVEKFKEGDRSTSSLGLYSNVANGHCPPSQQV